jgi:ABC-2 family transporter protein
VGEQAVTWVAWRQFRVPALVAFGLVAVVAVWLAATGTNLHHLYSTYTHHLAACSGQCGLLTQQFLDHDRHLYQALGTVLVALPAILGIFWGAPLVARERETGAVKLAWTQTVTRTRWLAVKLGVVAAAAALTAGVLSLLVTWWARPIDQINVNRFAAEIFSTRGLVPIGYAVFAVAAGTMIGAIIGRTLPAMAVTLVGYVAVHLAVIRWIRPHLIAATHVALPLQNAANLGFAGSPSGTTFFASDPSVAGVLVVSSRIADGSGRTANAATLHQFVVAHCPAIAAPPTGGLGVREPANTASFGHCLSKLSASYHQVVSVIPAGRYWDLQWAEMGLYLGLALGCGLATFWWIRRVRG